MDKAGEMPKIMPFIFPFIGKRLSNPFLTHCRSGQAIRQCYWLLDFRLSHLGVYTCILPSMNKDMPHPHPRTQAHTYTRTQPPTHAHTRPNIITSFSIPYQRSALTPNHQQPKIYQYWPIMCVRCNAQGLFWDTRSVLFQHRCGQTLRCY